MELVLEQATEVDLVVGDHGWAGAAAERGIDVVAVADINDPALPMARPRAGPASSSAWTTTSAPPLGL